MSLINNIRLKIGSSPGQTPLNLPDAPVTLIVGPNNSGKSLLLKEINDSLRENRPSSDFRILNELEFNPASLLDAATEIQNNKSTISTNGTTRAANGLIFYRRNGEEQQLGEASVNEFITQPKIGTPPFKLYVKYHTIKLDGPTRTALVQEKSLGDLTQPPTNRLALLFSDDATRLTLRKVIHSALQAYLVVDPTHSGHVRLRLSPVAPSSHVLEKGLHAEAVAFHRNAVDLKDASDGIKAFCGILVELYAGDPKILLIDEPEAFLHPSLAFMLGKAAASRAQETGKQLIVSTHSASFLKGCLQSGAKVNVVRLTYTDGVGTARLLPSAQLTDFMRNPLLRSVGVLNGLFYEGVVVTEGDTDRAFYDEINERLLYENVGRGARNCLFLNAQNKQTVHTILTLLRSLGIPAAGIVDIDALKEGGTNWSNFLRSGGIPAVTVTGYANMRSNLHGKLVTVGNMKKDGGIALLSGEDLSAAKDLIEALNDYGLFIVPGGEVERWLKTLAIDGHGSHWLIPMFQRLGDNPNDASFIQPAQNDVWEFVNVISKWLSNSQRKGLQP